MKPRRGMAPGAGPSDSVAVRRHNLALVLRHLRDAGPRSRARVAAETGLNKATVSSLVADLESRGLVADTGPDAARVGAVGRTGTAVAVDGRGVAGIGLEVNVDYVAVLVLDLGGRVVFEERRALDVVAAGPDQALDLLAKLVAEAVGACQVSSAVPVGITVAVPGLVETEAGIVRIGPNLGWRSVHAVEGLAERLDRPPYPIAVDNDATLSAVAEHAMGSAAGTRDLVVVTGEVGVGAGIVVDGRLLRGNAGFSGEVGHMPLDPLGFPCRCGRRGCWETVVGMSALLTAAADPDDPVRNPTLDLEARLAELLRRAESGDTRTLLALERIGSGLAVGAAILLDLFNPAVLVLGGYFASLGSYLVPALESRLHELVVAPGLGGCRVELSTLGFTAAARGGAWRALDTVLDDPTTIPVADPAAAPLVPGGPA